MLNTHAYHPTLPSNLQFATEHKEGISIHINLSRRGWHRQLAGCGGVWRWPRNFGQPDKETRIKSPVRPELVEGLAVPN